MRPHTVDTSRMTATERHKVLAQAVYTGHEVEDDPLSGIMIITKPKPMIRHKPKRRFT